MDRWNKTFKTGDRVRYIGQDYDSLYVKTNTDYTVKTYSNVHGLTLFEIHKAHSYNPEQFELIPEPELSFFD